MNKLAILSCAVCTAISAVLLSGCDSNKEKVQKEAVVLFKAEKYDDAIKLAQTTPITLPELQHFMGCAYINEWGGLSRDAETAVKFYTKAAEQGYAPSLSELGKCYQDGEGVMIDGEKAVELYTKAVEQGDVKAMSRLGYCYANGIGVYKDIAKALEWSTKAAEGGIVQAMFNVGAIYHNGGDGLEKNPEKAFEWWEKAAEKGHVIAQANLGVFYNRAIGVKKDDTKAREWFEKAAANGSSTAMQQLGCIYYNGDGVEKDLARALEWFEKAATNGNSLAMQQLGYFYYNGDGVEKDLARALEWWKKAAEKGDGVSAWNAYIIVKNGQGVPKDMDEAMKWLKVASDNGHADAKKLYETMLKLQKKPESLIEFGKTLGDIPSDMKEERDEYCKQNSNFLENIVLTSENSMDVYMVVTALNGDMRKRVIADIQAAGRNVWETFAAKYANKKPTEMNIQTFSKQNAGAFCIIPKAEISSVSADRSYLNVYEKQRKYAWEHFVRIRLVKPKKTGISKQWTDEYKRDVMIGGLPFVRSEAPERVLKLIQSTALDQNDVEEEQVVTVAGFINPESFGDDIDISGYIYGDMTESKQ